jgi:hypothetical protein
MAVVEFPFLTGDEDAAQNWPMARGEARFDHQLPGFVILVGALFEAAGVALLWLRASTRKLSAGIAGLSTDIQIDQSYGGIADGGSVLLIFVAVTLIFGLVLMARRARRGLGIRLVALVFGLVPAALGAYCIAAPTDAYLSLYDPNSRVHDVLRVATSTGALTVEAETGAYLMGLGGLVILVGALMPGRRHELTGP